MTFAITINVKNYSVLVAFPVDILDETKVKPTLKRMNRLSVAPPFLRRMG